MKNKQTFFFPSSTSAYASISIILGSFGLASCSSSPRPVNDMEYSQVSSQVTSLEQDLNDAKANQVNVLAPKSFNEAKDSLKDAKKELDNNADAKNIAKPVESGRASLAVARSVADQNRSAVPDIVKARQDAMNADAPHFATDSWAKAEDDFKDGMKRLERDPSNTLSNNDRKEIQDRYAKSQVEALKWQHLALLKEKVKDLDNEGAGKIVPNAMQDTKNKIAAADSTIDADRNNPDLIERSSFEAQASYERTRALFERAKTVQNGSPEEVANAMLKKDIREDSLSHQLNQNTRSLAEAENSQQAMGAHRAFMTSVRQKFPSDSADVYQQGDNVLIRLKGLQFKTGQNDIPAQSASLLETVKETLKETPNSEVVIQGHTDTVGSASRNKELSQDRADAIKEFLAADPEISEDRIITKGYGYEQPISTNKTAEGRAQNRRVDILIKDVETSGSQSPSGRSVQ